MFQLQIVLENMCGVKKLKMLFSFKLSTSKSGKEKQLEFSEIRNLDVKDKELDLDYQPRKSAFKIINPETSGNNFSKQDSKKHVRFSHMDLSIIDDRGSTKNFRSPLPSSRRHLGESG